MDEARGAGRDRSAASGGRTTSAACGLAVSPRCICLNQQEERPRRGVLIGLTVLAVAPPARAGVYNLAEPPAVVSEIENTRKKVLEERAIAIDTGKAPKPESDRARVLRRAAALEEAQREG